jgi:hypothetical protein
MIQTQSGAGEIRASTCAKDSASRQPTKVTPIIATSPGRPHRPSQRRSPHFDPNIEQTRCSSCGGGRDGGWRQWHSIGGAWAHCPPSELVEAEHQDRRHTCTAYCAGIGGAA